MEPALPPRIALLTAVLEDPYQAEVWRGARQEAEALGLNLVCFAGHRIGSPLHRELQETVLFELAAYCPFDALIVVANAISTFVTSDELESFLSPWQRLPIVLVGTSLPGRRSVSVVSEGGIRAAVDHVVGDHGRRRLLFLAGPRQHQESQLREREFRQASEAWFPGVEPLVRYCDFQGDVAWGEVEKLVTAGVAFDAVVAASDPMAAGAIGALEAAGIEVPRQVSVTGFDDTAESRTMVPALTTVRQPAADLGRRAVRETARSLHRAVPTTAEEDQVRFLVRESCGCRAGADGGPDLDRRLRKQGALRRLDEKRRSDQRAIEMDVISSLETSEVLRAVARGIQFLHIPSCHLVRYSAEGGVNRKAYLLLSVEGASVQVHEAGIEFPLVDLVPGGRAALGPGCIVDPLGLGDHHLGYVVRSQEGDDPRIFESLRQQAAEAIKGTLLMAEEKARERQLELDVQKQIEELSVTNQRLREEARQRQALEREILTVANDLMGRIGRDIHDDLCQEIAGIGLMAALLEGRLKRADNPSAPGWAQAAAEIATAASRTAARAKGFARSLYPTELEVQGLGRALADLVRSARSRSEATIELTLPDPIPLEDPDQVLQIYRIIQEALGNAIVHAKATRIEVSLEAEDGVVARVSDNGIGMKLRGRKAEGGMGMKIMRYRAGVIGARFDIRSSESGTTVTCRIER